MCGSPRPGRVSSDVTWIVLLGCNDNSKRGQNCCQERKQENSTLIDKAFLARYGTSLSTSLRRACLCLLSLRYSQPVSAMLPFSTLKSHSLIQFIGPCHSSIWWLYVILAERFLIRKECGNFPLCVLLPISTYIKGDASFGKMQVRNLRLSSVSCDWSNMYPWVASVTCRYACNRPLLSWECTCAICENWFLSRTFFKTIYFAFSKMSR